MKLLKTISASRAQTTMEYLMILTVVGVVVLASMKLFLPKVNNSSEEYFNSVTRVVLGEKPQPINGGWCKVDGPIINSSVPIYRTCECPAPAFGGNYCSPTATYSTAHLSCVGEKCTVTNQGST